MRKRGSHGCTGSHGCMSHASLSTTALKLNYCCAGRRLRCCALWSRLAKAGAHTAYAVVRLASLYPRHDAVMFLPLLIRLNSRLIELLTLGAVLI